MQFSFSYEKSKVIQGLRYHFISRGDIKWMMILVNIFAVISALLFYSKKIRPEPFLLGSLIWILMMSGVWYLLPYTIYKKTATFKDSFILSVKANYIHLETEIGYTQWEWNRFSRYFESPHFFHLYFNEKTFFLIPKENMNESLLHEFRGILQEKIR